MKVLYYDCFMGISGDMNLAAMIDIGVDKDHLVTELKKLQINDEFEIQVSGQQKNGITGTKVDVVLKHEHAHHHEHGHHTPHRHYEDIKKMIETSELSDFVKKRSIETFDKIAVAEAKIHGTTVNKVHFHEVGATDSIVDIVGNAICIEFLNPDLVISSPVQLGGGFVKCDHGTFPVPAPATAEILKEIPVKTGLVDGETTTPTGAAIIVSNASRIMDQADFIITKIGYGLGTKEFEVPNVLRIMLGEIKSENSEKSYVCEANIDDMNPEVYGHIMDRLFSLGANDVYITSVMMKKNRPANKISVLCKESEREAIIKCILLETTSFGLRYYEAKKVEMDRVSKEIEIDGIKVRIKYAFFQNKMVKYKPEYDDCLKLAAEKSISLANVFKLVEKKIQELNGS